MPRPAFTTKLSLPHRLKQNTATGSSTPAPSIPSSRTGSPKRTMSDVKPGLVLRANVIKVRAPRGRVGETGEHPLTDAGPQPRCKGPQRHLGPGACPPPQNNLGMRVPR